MFIKAIFADSKKLKELEIMCQNAIYICISWYSKICWFPVKKYWCQQNSRGMSRDLYIFWIFFVYGITAKFHHCKICVRNFREGRIFCTPPRPFREQPQKSPSYIGFKIISLFYLFYLPCLIYGSIFSLITQTFACLHPCILSKNSNSC